MGWHLANEINWIDGTSGRGFITHDGDVHTWTTGEDDSPVHLDYANHHGIDWDDVLWPFYIDPDGGVRTYFTEGPHDDVRQQVRDADPRLNVENEPSWHFGSDEGDVLNWDEGNEGKGLLDENGHLHTWNADDYELHQDYLREHPHIIPAAYVEINPSGRVDPVGLHQGLTETQRDILREADPRLHTSNDVPQWSF